MPVRPDDSPSRGITLPPHGWGLALLLVLYILPGLIGHDPWKVDDAVTIGVVHSMLRDGHWLLPHLAGQPYPDAPFYYWIAAASGQLFSWLLPLHDAARLASGALTLLALGFILLATRELHGRENAAAGPLILAGSIGFLFHAHEAQPMLAALTAHTAAYWGLTLLARRPRAGALIFGGATGLAFLANGLITTLALLPVALFAGIHASNRKQALGALLAGLLPALALPALWLLPVLDVAPEYFAAFWQGELRAPASEVSTWHNVWQYLELLPWYAWPALPLAAWTLWRRRRALGATQVALPLFAFATMLLILGLCFSARSAPTLLLLPPLVLLAAPGAATLRRGAANAFDWFGMITFSLFAVLAWVGWSAMVFDWPTRLAHQVVRLEPGFVGHFSLPAFAVALLATLAWAWLIASSPRSPMRGVTHWMAGVTLFWLLIAVLWMPWIDYGKTYRPLSGELARALPAKHGCIASDLPRATLASLDYFDGIRTQPIASAAGKRCDWRLTPGTGVEDGAPRGAKWRKVWEGGRPSDRRGKLYLYRREAAAPETSAGKDDGGSGERAAG